jgi:hypothetical protein
MKSRGSANVKLSIDRYVFGVSLPLSLYDLGAGHARHTSSGACTSVRGKLQSDLPAW